MYSVYTCWIWFMLIFHIYIALEQVREIIWYTMYHETIIWYTLYHDTFIWCTMHHETNYEMLKLYNTHVARFKDVFWITKRNIPTLGLCEDEWFSPLLSLCLCIAVYILIKYQLPQDVMYKCINSLKTKTKNINNKTCIWENMNRSYKLYK